MAVPTLDDRAPPMHKHKEEGRLVHYLNLVRAGDEFPSDWAMVALLDVLHQEYQLSVEVP